MCKNCLAHKRDSVKAGPFSFLHCIPFLNKLTGCASFLQDAAVHPFIQQILSGHLTVLITVISTRGEDAKRKELDTHIVLREL